MNPVEVIRTALSAISQNKFRALLTMLGIAIGVAAVISVLAVGRGAEEAVRQEVERMAACQLAVYGFWDSQSQRYYPLKLEDIEIVRNELTSAQYVVPASWLPGDLSYRGQQIETEMSGTSADMFKMFNLKPAVGRFFTQEEENLNRPVVVLGYKIGQKVLARSQRTVGETVRIGGRSFQIVGVMEETGVTEMANFWRPDERVYVPLTVGIDVFGFISLNGILIRAPDSRDLEQVAMDLERTMRRSHRLVPGEKNNFRIMNLFDYGKIQQGNSKTFGEMLSAIATISLIVGGLGIVNIMLVSVTERTREIGVRKALGARSANILSQVLTEAIILCLVGGLVGVGVGYAFAETVVRNAGWTVIVTPDSVVLGVVVSVIVGVIAGVWPAVRAARMQPVEALRYD